jgi:hypothetical protein
MMEENTAHSSKQHKEREMLKPLDNARGINCLK